MSESNSTTADVPDKTIQPATPATRLQLATTAKSRPAKPSKPYPEYPLTAHPAGYWCKKIKGKLYYFGPWSDPDGALDKYLAEKEAREAGRKPRVDSEGVTVKEVANHFLNAKKALVDNGELSPRTLTGYMEACKEVLTTFGKARRVDDLDPDDFAKLRNHMAKRLGFHGLGTFIQCIRCLFKHAADNELIDKPVKYGSSFKRPSKKVIRKHKAESGPNLFTADEVRRLIGAAVPQLKAMILLAINCGYGNADCGMLPLSAVDLAGAMIDFPRPKTGVPRRCPLWPETVQALREILDQRKKPKDEKHTHLFFITRCGDSWAKETAENPITDLMAKLIRKLGINGRKGLGFYTLRHTHRTVADEAKDQPASDFVMGHEVESMSSVYRETISDERLKAVTDHVHAWLFPPAPKPMVKTATTEVATGLTATPE